MKLVYHILILLFFSQVMAAGNQDPIFGKFPVSEFDFNRRNAKIVFPKKPNEDRLWVWRARFWGHEPQTDIALLEQGFHVVYIDVAGLFGNDEAVEVWNDFYKYMVKKYHLNPKTVLEGMSRGGLIIYNWAAQNTDKVFCIYADAPVCDIKSWPGGLYSGKGSEKDWQECLDAYGLDKESVLDFEDIPISTSVKVAEAKIPVLHICGDSDKVVPFEENTAKLEEKFKEAGGDIRIILKKDNGHHPHGLQDPKPIVDFILNHTKT